MNHIAGRSWTIIAQLTVITLVGTRPASSAPVTTGLSLWLNADVGFATNSSGDVSWLDQSGQGHNASQSNSQYAPTLKVKQFNGQNYLSFNGSEFLNIAGQVLTSQQFTIIAIGNDARGSSDTNHREIFSNWASSPTNEVTSVFLGTTNQNPTRARFTDQMGGATDPQNYQRGIGTISTPATPFVLSAVSGASDATIYQNAAAIADEGTPLSTRDLNTPYFVGEQGGAYSEGWVGTIAELLVYNIALTPDQLHQDWLYLDAKYFPLAGDANGDGIVNGQDIGAIASHWLATGSNLPGDTNGDGIVNAQDIANVASHWLDVATWHASTAGSVANVPEPTTLVLATLGSLFLLASHLRRRIQSAA